jgi:hypothetical protein
MEAVASGVVCAGPIGPSCNTSMSTNSTTSETLTPAKCARRWRGSRTLRCSRTVSGDRERTFPAMNHRSFTEGATDYGKRGEMVELRGFEPLTPRLPALCSPN